jgi:iron complex transport system permease protein
MEQGYQGYVKKKRLWLLALLAGVVALSLWATTLGSSGLGISQVVGALFGQEQASVQAVVWNIRLPRIVTALVVGAGLAAAGCVMQSVLKNPIADTSTLGVSHGAAFGASFAILCLGAGAQGSAGVAIYHPATVSLCAFLGAMGVTAVLLVLSRFRRITPETMVLCGVALSSLFSGGTTLLQYFADDTQLAAVVFWTFGDLGRTSWQEVGIMAALAAVALVFFYLNRWNYNALKSGAGVAHSLGVPVDRLRVVSMVVCALTAAAMVSFVGILHFVGLIAPHLMRRLVGEDDRYLLPASALCGAALLLVADTVARMVLSPVILPIGAVTSFCGAPVFLYLLCKGRDRG